MIFFPLLLFSLVFVSLPSGAEVINLTNGDKLSGEIKSENQHSITLHHSVLGDIIIPKKQIAVLPGKDNVTEDSGPDETETAAKKTASEPKTEVEKTVTATTLVNQPVKKSTRLPGVFGTGFLEGWKHHLAFGVKGEAGNDVSMDLSAAYNTSFESKTHRFNIESAYYYETDEYEKDTNKGHINIVRDWLMPDSDWFVYGYGRYEYDDFKSWEHRVSISAGPGYDFYNEKDLKLNGRIGLGFSKSWGDENDFDIEGQLGMNWLWRPASLKNQVISSQIIIYPVLNDLGEYRTWMEGKWHFDIDLYRGLGFEVGFEYEYDSDNKNNLDGETSYDLLYFGRIGLDF